MIIKTFEGWLADSKLKNAKVITWIGLKPTTVPEEYAVADLPLGEYTCDAVFISCRKELCDNFMSAHIRPMISMNDQLLVFWCWASGADHESCLFMQAKRSMAFGMLDRSIEHDSLNETCFTGVRLIKTIFSLSEQND